MADDSPRAIIPQHVLNEFIEKTHILVKKMLYDGFTPKTKLWIITKKSGMLDIGKSMNISVTFEEEELVWADKLLKRFKRLHDYEFLKFLNIFWSIKKHLKRYYWMDGLRLWVKLAPKMGEIVQDYQLLDIWEPETTAIVKREVKEGMTCLDIGASIGYFTLQFARLVGKSGRVIAIEPTDFQQPYLLKNIHNNGFDDIVEVHNVGAWDKSEYVAMPLNAPPYVQTKAPCVAVDEIVGQQAVHFIKMDCDGPEPKILKGLERTFQNNPGLKMVIEYYPEYIRNAGLDPQEFKDVIDKYFKFEIIPGDYTDGCWNLFCTRCDNAKNVWPTEVTA